MGMAKQIALASLGAIIIVVALIVWAYATGTMTSLAENIWCASIGKTVECHFRGYQHFLVWTVLGIINLLVLGLLSERIADRFRR
jgi:hypothetical protein